MAQKLRTTTSVLAGVLAFVGVALAAPAESSAEVVYSDLSGKAGVEGRWFPRNPLHDGQKPSGASFFIKPELYLEDDNGYGLIIVPFFRYDSADSNRTHTDLSEAYALLFGEAGDGEWELRLGFDKVFWGVADSHHLIDIINQTDFIEDPNQEKKLGQPMAHATWLADFGVIEVYVMPYFRERTFQARSGRLRNTLVVDTDQAAYESAAGRHHVDLAARYSHSVNIFDFGFSVFDGTNRAPTLTLGLDPRGSLVLVPTYDQVRQYSLDMQATAGAWLLKLEAAWRDGEKDRALIEDDYGALVAGLEYSFYGVFDSNVDLGLIAEFLYDERDGRATNPFENDIFGAVRLVLNDAKSTELLTGMIRDIDQSTSSAFVEANRRINDNWSAGLKGTAFLEVSDADVQFPLRRDNFLELTAIYNF